MSVSYPFRRILVPTDFSTCSDSALELGANLAADQGAELIALHVVDLGHVSSKAVIHTAAHPEGILVGDHAIALATSEITRRLDRLGAKVLNRSSRISLGAPVRAICAAVAELGVDLVVMGTHGRGGLAHIVMGSVAEKVLRTAKIPVLTVREETCIDRPLDPGTAGEDMG